MPTCRIPLFILALSGVLLLQGCAKNLKSAWETVASRCAVSDIDGNHTLFFGASNSLGPGSIWRKAPADSGGGYRVRWRATDIPTTHDWALAGQNFSCDGTSSLVLSGDLAANFSADILPVTGELQTDLSKADNVQVNTTTMRWDNVVEGPFEETIAQLPDTDPLKEDLAQPGRLVLYRALQVQGFNAVLTFKRNIAENLKGKYPNSMVLPGHATLSANLKWVNETALHIAVPSGFYIAGQLVPFNTQTGFMSDPGGAKPVEVR